MDLDQAIGLRNQLRTHKVIMAYNGAVSDDLMLTLADLLKSRMLAQDDPKRSKTIFSVFMEGVQNLIWHGGDDSDTSGMILITQEEGQVTIMCSNRIAQKDTFELRERLSQIENADKETIRQLYREGMSSSNEHEGPGAGLGLLEIARRSSQPISYAFVDVDKHTVDFILAATI
ncbi:SiaB family protein kinase [Limnohabitans sp. B9-3]|uniref:SiaB family protein kinase n=1 Tax=Limnohabitans sp. B9-3 TaxID=1100707 RepID=UPI000C1DC86E|nr:SiaB family protein kinase [Limnohabitans sp. B9-3]PIT77430.1 hypothetical protein B9Z42_02870 [Limnohabitans sp. B9-3]